MLGVLLISGVSCAIRSECRVRTTNVRDDFTNADLFFQGKPEFVGPTIIYCPTQKMVESTHDELRNLGVKCSPCEGQSRHARSGESCFTRPLYMRILGSTVSTMLYLRIDRLAHSPTHRPHGSVPCRPRRSRRSPTVRSAQGVFDR